MAQLSNVRRIIVEDYPEANREMIEKLSYILNNFMEEVVVAFNGNIDFKNLTRRMMTFELTVDSNGRPLNNNRLQTNLGQVSAIYVGKVVNILNPNNYVTQVPFINFNYLGSGAVQITTAIGLQPNIKYRVTAELVA